MKKSVLKALGLGMGLMAATPVVAQQLPNVGFEAWRTVCGDSEQIESKNGTMRTRPGVEPTDWNGSSVCQKIGFEVKKELVFQAGSEDNRYVRLKNIYVGVGTLGAVAPGFLNFGTPWVYASIKMAECDGGVYGGLAFAFRPDGLALDVNRVDENDEYSRVIAYLWNGTAKSKVGNAGTPTVERENVDRAVIGRQGVELLEGSNVKLIAELQDSLKTTGGQWQSLAVPFSYHSEDVPDFINVVVSAGDYWTRSNLKENTELLVDNVRLYYSSRLNSLEVNGIAVPDFSSDKFEYDMDEYFPADADVTFEKSGVTKSADVKITTDLENNAYVISVANVAEDIDGRSAHTYVLKYKKPEPVSYDGYLNIKMNGSSIGDTNAASTVTVTQTGDTTCTFVLPNFSLDLGEGPVSLGDIVVENVSMTTADGVTTYKGHDDELSLLEGTLTVSVDLNGTIDANGVADLKIDVMWEGIPINVTFTSDEVVFYESKNYDGYLNIAMNGSTIGEENVDATVCVTPTGETTATVSLPNFSLDLGDGPVSLGDIVVADVEVSKDANGTSTYKGHVDDFELLGGQIVADIDLVGTITADDKVDMTINVIWNEIPIIVTFTTDKVVAIEGIASDEVSPDAQWFTLQGMRVYGRNLPAGIYIRRQGNDVVKVIIR